MYSKAEKQKDNKSRLAGNTASQKKSGSESTFQFVDNRPVAIAQQYQPSQKKENNTGLPDNLKSGIENLSGYSMDDVKVHYNSPKAAQLQAHAYAQGTDIHLASGQEKYLPHEAWHVVQQKQRRVQPTTQLKGKVNINDDEVLEKEADVMGAKALQLKAAVLNVKESSSFTNITNLPPIIQRVAFLTDSVPFIPFPDNTATHFEDTMKVYSSGFGENNTAEALGFYYLYQYSLYKDRKTKVPTYKGTSFNATLPITSEGSTANFNFEFNYDNTEATVTLMGLGAVGAHIANHKGGKDGAILKLKKDFNIKAVVDGSATWTVAELAKVDAAFSLISDADQAVLDGLVLERVVDKPGSGGEHTHNLATFTHKIRLDGVDLFNSRKIKFTNKAFGSDSKDDDAGRAPSFLEDEKGNLVPVSFQTIIHEVGHAVELHTYLTKLFEYYTAEKITNIANETRNLLVDDFNLAVKKSEEEVIKWNKFVYDHTDQMNEQIVLIREATKALDLDVNAVKTLRYALDNDIMALFKADKSTPEAVSKLRDTLETFPSKAVKDAVEKIIALQEKKWAGDQGANYKELRKKLYRDYLVHSEEVYKTLSKQHKKSIQREKAYVAKERKLREFSNSVLDQTIDETFVMPAIPDEIIDLGVNGPAQAMLDAHKVYHELSAKLKLATRDRDTKEVTSDGLKVAVDKTEKDGTTRIQNFVAYVTKYGIAPTAEKPLTDYALSSWLAGNKGEYYAEAYSMFHTNPNFLRNEYRELYDYFYLKLHNRDRLMDVTFGPDDIVRTKYLE